jgi:hypothetical protein
MLNLTQEKLVKLKEKKEEEEEKKLAYDGNIHSQL